MSEGTTKKAEPVGVEAARSSVVAESDIDTSDVPEVKDWTKAVRGRHYVGPATFAVDIDADIVAWFRRRHGDSARSINELLRTHMTAATGGSRRPARRTRA